MNIDYSGDYFSSGDQYNTYRSNPYTAELINTYQTKKEQYQENFDEKEQPSSIIQQLQSNTPVTVAQPTEKNGGTNDYESLYKKIMDNPDTQFFLLFFLIILVYYKLSQKLEYLILHNLMMGQGVNRVYDLNKQNYNYVQS